MIPILYEKTETAFHSNGLGRLRDVIEATVTEERNGVYELEFQYPIGGINFDKIKIGRIVAAEHDDSGDIQPFDIVSYERPINGVVTFHCVHVSYRQSYMTVNGTNINSLSDAFTALGNAQPSNPFTYWTDKASTGYVGAFDGVPKTVRSMLGGTEGSILDAYGGEYEWDRFTVRLHSSRGRQRNFTIRYGVNMLDYNDETDASECYSSCIPYWTDGTTTVVGDKQSLATLPPSGRDACVPMDVSEKFDSSGGAIPTKAQVNAMGLSVLNSGQPYLPTQNITVSFARLQEMPEYSQFSSLLRCGLCDTIRVIFPDYQSSGTFKIVRMVWNVLLERYDEMELGDLSTSLSEALGISDMQKDSKSTIEQIVDQMTYKAGDTVSISTNGMVQYAGKWANATSFRFGIPLDRPVASGTNIAVSGTIYVSSGGSGGSVTLGNGNTVSCEVRGSVLGVMLTFSSNQSIAHANYAAAVQSAGLTITFS